MTHVAIYTNKQTNKQTNNQANKQQKRKQKTSNKKQKTKNKTKNVRRTNRYTLPWGMVMVRSPSTTTCGTWDPALAGRAFKLACNMKASDYVCNASFSLSMHFSVLDSILKREVCYLSQRHTYSLHSSENVVLRETHFVLPVYSLLVPCSRKKAFAKL